MPHVQEIFLICYNGKLDYVLICLSVYISPFAAEDTDAAYDYTALISWDYNQQTTSISILEYRYLVTLKQQDYEV